jgi:acyl dehydratase
MQYYEDVVLNKEHKSRAYFVSKEALIAFAKQWDPQPFHVDEEYAKNSPTGLIGTSVHSYAILTKLLTEVAIGDDPLAMVAGMGIDQWRMPNPLRPGDNVYAVSYVEAKRESASKPNMGILTCVAKLLNDNDEVILSYKSNGLILKRPQK